jgi:hypothetical protein
LFCGDLKKTIQQQPVHISSPFFQNVWLGLFSLSGYGGRSFTDETNRGSVYDNFFSAAFHRNNSVGQAFKRSFGRKVKK